MKRSKAGIALIIIGLALAILAPVWRWGIGPMFIRIPDDINLKSIYEGTLKLFVDPKSLQLLPPGTEVTIPLTITRTDESVPRKSTGGVAVLNEKVLAKGPGGESYLQSDKYYAMDRKTSENVPKQNSDQDRTGYFLMLPMSAKKITYKMWDDDTRTTPDARFVKEMTVDGNNYKGVKVYVYKASGTDKMVVPPLGLPEKISGKDIKTILNNPNMLLSDTELYPIDFVKKGTATIVAEPRTGAIVDLPAYHEEYFVDASAMGVGNIKLATLDYAQTKENVRTVIDDNAKYFSSLDLVTLWIPLMLVVLGLIVLIPGVLLSARKKTAG